MAHGPSLSVVLPLSATGARLRACLDSLVAQTHTALEVVLVDDGSLAGAGEVARAYVDRQPGFRLVVSAQAGVAASRDAGLAAASGDYLAVCDAEDEVPPTAYARLVSALSSSGSGVAVGSVALERRGRYRQPDWAHRAHPRRQLSASLAGAPGIMANLVLGARVFHRSVWEATGRSFAESGDHGDVVAVVAVMLAAESFDVLPAVCYRQAAPRAGSLRGRAHSEPEAARLRVRALRGAGEVIAHGAAGRPSQEFVAQAVHEAAELVRSGVYQGPGYWSALVEELGPMLGDVGMPSLQEVPVLDRLTAWLCAHDDRAAAEDFVDHAAEQGDGLPFDVRDGFAHIRHPSAPPALTRVAARDLVPRIQLAALSWAEPGVLHLAGAGFVEYTPGSSPVELVLRGSTAGEEVAVPTQRLVDPDVNAWAGRAFEDHADAGFEARVDVGALATLPGASAFDVLVRISHTGGTSEQPFGSRRAGGLPGLLESRTVDGRQVACEWTELTGLRLRVGSKDQESSAPVDEAAVLVDTIALDGDALSLTGSASAELEVSLGGSHEQTSWVWTVREGHDFTVSVPLGNDEWGLGAASLPRGEYAVRARTPDGAQREVRVTGELWRSLPMVVESDTLLVHPLALGDRGSLSLRLGPVEDRDSRAPFQRQQLRDRTYPDAVHGSVVDSVLFEVFAGKSAGDNPGQVCAELARRDTGLDLAFSVVDRSVRVPASARPVVRWSTEWFELLARSRYLVVNAVLPRFVRKRPGQVVVQTWHGSPLKRIAHDRGDTGFGDWRHRRQLDVATGTWDYLLSQSPFATATLRGAFRYEGEVLELGYPRNDPLLASTADDVRRRVRGVLGIPVDAEVVLYAPTWRDDQRTGSAFAKVQHLDAARVVDRLEEAFVLFRGHHNTLSAAELGGQDRRILDVTRYPEIADLYLAADALVTDYSSALFDFVLTGKPMVFLAPDLSEFRDESRGFYLDYLDTVPGPVCVETDEVIEVLRGPDTYAAARAEFRARYVPWDDGHASRRVVDALLG